MIGDSIFLRGKEKNNWRDKWWIQTNFIRREVKEARIFLASKIFPVLALHFVVLHEFYIWLCMSRPSKVLCNHEQLSKNRSSRHMFGSDWGKYWWQQEWDAESRVSVINPLIWSNPKLFNTAVSNTVRRALVAPVAGWTVNILWWCQFDWPSR